MMFRNQITSPTMAVPISSLSKKEERKENKNKDEVGGIYQVSNANYRSPSL
jgi:hypothetical protein